MAPACFLAFSLTLQVLPGPEWDRQQHTALRELCARGLRKIFRAPQLAVAVPNFVGISTPQAAAEVLPALSACWLCQAPRCSLPEWARSAWAVSGEEF